MWQPSLQFISPPWLPAPPASAPQLQQLGDSKLEPFLSRAGVWARMSPDDKRTLMELLGDGSLGEDGAEVAGQVGGSERGWMVWH